MRQRLEEARGALLEEAEKNAHYLQSKSLRGGEYPEIEEKVVRFVEEARSCKIPVTQSTIKERGILVRDEILRRDALEMRNRHKSSCSRGALSGA